MDVDGLLDSRNIELWDNLKSDWDIKVEVGDYDSPGVFTKNETAIIYMPKNQLNVPSFTHELLHVFLHAKGARIGNYITLYVREKLRLKNVLSENLIDHIGNCLSHIKMLPMFIQMGFDKRDFLSDYHINKLNDTVIDELKRNFKKKSLFGNPYFSKTYVDLYIGKYFAAKSCPNTDFDYSKGLHQLKMLNSELYSILDNLMNKWIDFDVNEIEDPLSPYIDMQFEFVDEIENWLKSNKTK